MAKEREKDEGEVELRRGGKLTRAGMVDVINRGGAVLYEGTLYTKEADLPDEATLLEGDAEASRNAVAGLDAHIATLAAQRAALERNVVGSERPKAAASAHDRDRDKK